MKTTDTGRVIIVVVVVIFVAVIVIARVTAARVIAVITVRRIRRIVIVAVCIRIVVQVIVLCETDVRPAKGEEGEQQGEQIISFHFTDILFDNYFNALF